jgi:hypothetical protein
MRSGGEGGVKQYWADDTSKEEQYVKDILGPGSIMLIASLKSLCLFFNHEVTLTVFVYLDAVVIGLLLRIVAYTTRQVYKRSFDNNTRHVQDKHNFFLLLYLQYI